MSMVTSIDPRTGVVVEELGQETGQHDLERVCADAAAAARTLEAMTPTSRARMLRAMADALKAREAQIVEVGDRETALGASRLAGELARTCFQLELFAEVLEEASYLEATIDHAGQTGMGPRPDTRRMLIPIGPVAVFGASNFPLAFSVPGGDTASALAAGCSVVAKAHEAHPATSEACLEALREGAQRAGGPREVISLVHGQEAGRRLVTHPVVRAVGFTGSPGGGRALFDLANSRPEPIPFYGEMGSVNPMIVTREAAENRAAEIGQGYANSFSLGVGQFCTKPGLLFLPTGSGGAQVREALVQAVSKLPGGVMLSRRIYDAFDAGVRRIAVLPRVRRLAPATAEQREEFLGLPVLLGTDMDTFVSEQGRVLREECFGPVSVVVEYATEAQLVAAVEQLSPSLTASVQLGPDETGLPVGLKRLLERRCGRLVFNGYPTGVAVGWAMHHGGPYPATTSELHTSVGATAIRRFLRPICYQDAPAPLLPEPLQDSNPWNVPQRVDGELQLPR